MMLWLKTALRLLLRTRRTSLILMLMMMVAVAAMIFLASLAMGINDAMIRNSVGLITGHLSGEKIPNSFRPEQMHTDGVEHVLRRIPVTGVLKHKDRTDRLTVVGVTPAQEQAATVFWKKTIKGRFLKDKADEIYISQAVSEQLNIDVSDRVEFYGSSQAVGIIFTVAGIYETGISRMDDSLAFCTLSSVEGMTTNWSAGVFLKDGVEPDLILTRLEKKGVPHDIFKTWQQVMPDLEQLISLNYVSMNTVMVIVFVIVSMGITSALFIYIFKSIRDFGILKVMGVMPMEQLLFLFLIVATINVVSSGVGMLLGSLVVSVFHQTGIDLSAYTSHNQYFIVSGIIYPRLTLYSLILPPLCALVFSLPAVIGPAVMVIRKSAAEILRSR